MMVLSTLRAATSFLRSPFSSRGCFGCPNPISPNTRTASYNGRRSVA